MMVAVESVKQGVTEGEDTLSGSTFADDFVGISETPEGLQKQIESSRNHSEMKSDSERKKMCSSCMYSRWPDIAVP